MTDQPDKSQTYPNCFGCGCANRYGLRLALQADESEVSAEFTPEPRHEGWPGVVHGGIIAALLYEVMENWPYLNGEVTMMRSMDVRLAAPARVGRSIRAVSQLERRDGRNLSVGGKLECGDVLIARGRASLVVLSDEQRRRLGI